MSKPDCLTIEEIRTELTENGIDVDLLEKRVTHIVKERGGEFFVKHHGEVEKRAIVEKILNARDLSRSFKEFEEKAKKIVISSFGQAAGSLIEAHFRNRDDFSNSNIEDLIDYIDILEDMITRKDEKD